MEIRKVGNWIYYYDGGAAEYYAKATKEELEEWLDSEEAQNGSAAPFKMAIPEGDSIMFYDANADYPRETLKLSEFNAELSGDEQYKDWEDFFNSGGPEYFNMG